MEILFWTFLFLIVYCYFGYPVVLTVLAKIFPYTVHKSSVTCGDDLKSVKMTVILSVYNEADVIERKLNNLSALDYPADCLEVLIGSDGSDDQTNNLVERYCQRDHRFRFYRNDNRRGKMLVINELVSLAKGDVLVFTDARQTYHPQALKELVANFSDKKVGCVSGELIFRTQDDGVAKGVDLYWRYEKYLRIQESQLHSMLGATGAIYAIRKELFTPVPAKVVLDDVYVPLNIIKRGYRAVFDGAAMAFDDAAVNPREEFRRKARTLFGNYQIFSLFPEMFVPVYSPIAWQFFSHKLLRVLVPIFMLVLLPVNIWLWFLSHENYMFTQYHYGLIFLLQIIFYGMAVVGALARSKKYGILHFISRICYIPYVFCLLNFSALAGLIRFMLGKQDITWEKARNP